MAKWVRCTRSPIAVPGFRLPWFAAGIITRDEARRTEANYAKLLISLFACPNFAEMKS
jgi:hypothetical protein